MQTRIPSSQIIARWLTTLLLAVGSSALMAQTPPVPTNSPRIDAIRKSGELRVGVLNNAPWLNENTSGDDKPAWNGPAWMLASEYARLLGVKLRPVPVSHETKIPVLASNQVDMSITPLAETPERMKVVDFVIYSNTSVCMFGRAGNDKLTKINTVDGLNSPDITIAYFTGGAEENWVKVRFPKAKLRGVSSSGATAPVEEIMAKRADVAPINRVSWVSLSHKVSGLMAYPKENNCQGSQEKASPVGLAIDKNQPVYLAWLRQVEKTMQAKLTADESNVVEHMK